MQERSPQDRWIEGVAAGLIIIIGIGALLTMGTVTSSRPAYHNALMQQARQLGQVMFAWSVDNTAHGKAYPDGASSTEIFQKLMDDSYIMDPSIFYIPMPGKVPAVAGHKLRPENVCFDITGGVVPSDSDDVPLVFSTGYRVTYAAGAEATPALKPYPRYLLYNRQQFLGFPLGRTPISPGAAVFYKGNNAMWLRADGGGAPYAVPKFVAPTFSPKGKSFRQLTPDGVMPP